MSQPILFVCGRVEQAHLQSEEGWILEWRVELVFQTKTIRRHLP